MILQTTLFPPAAFPEVPLKDAETDRAVEAFLMKTQENGLADWKEFSALRWKARSVIVKCFVKANFVLPFYRPTRIHDSGGETEKTKRLRRILGDQAQRTILEHCDLSTKILDTLHDSSPEDGHRTRIILPSIVQNGQIFWLGLLQLSPGERRLLARSLLRTDIITDKIDPGGIAYLVSFKNLGGRKHPCFSYVSPQGTQLLYARSHHDASSLARSWNLKNPGMRACIDRIHQPKDQAKARKVKEMPILENGFYGKKWTTSRWLLVIAKQPVPMRI
jgi:hypothetical protein